MRFRAKSAQEFWALILALGINAGLAFARILTQPNSLSGLRVLSLILMPIGAVLLCYSYFAGFWEMDKDGLRQRRVPWINTKIKWCDVTRIESSWSSPYSLKIEYSRRRFGQRIGHIWPIPADREEFLAALRRYAPQAEFVDESRRSILTA